MSTVSAPRAATHPPGLYVLFFTEMWERYSFYSMMSILVLYMDEQLRFPEAQSGQIYGIYIAGVYFFPLLGGWLGDRFFGYFRMVLVGGVIIALGHFLLAMETLLTFYLALAGLALGAGLLKPNISTMVGNLYRERPQLKDTAYNIFYMGINIGGLLGPLCVAWFRARYGWAVALGSAGVAMLISLAIFIGFRRHLGEAGTVPTSVHSSAAREVDLPDARARINALLITFAIITVFWFGFYQNGFAFTLWARDHTDTTWAPEVFYASNSLFIILFTPPLVWLWGWLRARDAEPSTPSKLVIGMALTAACFALMWVAALSGGNTGRVSPAWLLTAYALLSLGEISLSPIGLSLVARMAPPKVRGLMMGAFFLTLSTGGYFAGFLGTQWGTMPNSRFFALVVVIVLAATALLVLVLRWLKPTFDRALSQG